MADRLTTASDEMFATRFDLRTSLASRVLQAFDDQKIIYCHWKSNEHLEAALAGLTDLDILIDARRLDDAYAVLSSFECRRGRVSAARNEPGLEDFFGVDPLTNRLVHFHVHWRLASGERHLKRFRLPWENDLLSSRIRDDATGAYMTHPAQEAVLAVVRAALKLRWRDRLRLGVSGGMKASVREEAVWLMKSTTEQAVRSTATSWLSPQAAEDILAVIADGATGKRLAAVRRSSLKQIGSQSSHSPVAAALVRWRREVAWLQRGVARHYRPRPVLHGRGGCAGGLIVAVIGADGSGKSTLTKDLRRWFAPKYDTYAVYLGSGDGPSSLLRMPLRWVKRHVAGTKAAPKTPGPPAAEMDKPLAVAKVVWALVLAREKRQKLEKAMLARTRGLLVIADRYPQTQFPGSNDGPLLTKWLQSGNLVQRKLAEHEHKPYELAGRFPPDLVLRLDVDPDVAHQRRPGQDREYLAGRAQLVSRLQFTQSRFGVVALDANSPYESVLRSAVHEIFSRM
jgi:thymidylate kinase